MGNGSNGVSSEGAQAGARSGGTRKNARGKAVVVYGKRQRQAGRRTRRRGVVVRVVWQAGRRKGGARSPTRAGGVVPAGKRNASSAEQAQRFQQLAVPNVGAGAVW